MVAVRLQHFVEVVLAVEEVGASLRQASPLRRDFEQPVGVQRDPRVWPVDEVCQLVGGVFVAVHLTWAEWCVRGVHSARARGGLYAHTNTPWLAVEVVHIPGGGAIGPGHGVTVLGVVGEVFEAGAFVLPLRPHLIDEAVMEEELRCVG